MNFFETKMGHQFFGGSVPRLIRAVEKVGTELERANNHAEAEAASRERMQGNELFERVLVFAETREEGDFNYEISRKQLRSLWVACCIWNNWFVDTATYDNAMLRLWEVVESKADADGDCYWSDFDSFDQYMCEDLV